ncbi:MAG: amino acid permease [Gammaproteobacteria bacterium]|nr:amino acid permease [Gammaproteobacteria bacterium]
MIENQRDAGLLRAVGPWGLAASTVCIVIGAGIFVVPARLAASIGAYAPLALLFCALAIGAVAICFAEGGSRLASSGGAYGYIALAFGPLVGFVAGVLAWLGCVLASGGVAAALADVVGSALPAQLWPVARVLVIVGALGGIALVNVGGVVRATRLVSAATLLKLVPLAVFVLVGAGAVHAANFAPTVQPDPAGLGRALILALFAFSGMEISLCASGEVAEPARTIPRALVIAMLGVTLLYVAIQVVAQGILGPALAHSSVPLADAMGRISPALRLLMLAGAAASMFGLLSSELLGNPRLLFAFARDGLLPRALARVHARSRVPHVAIMTNAGIAIMLALGGNFAQLAIWSTLATALLYILGCAAAWRLARRGVAQAGAPLGFRWLGSAAFVGIGSMLAMVALARREELLGLAGVVGASVLAFLWLARGRHPVAAAKEG